MIALAKLLDTMQTRDLAWWELQRTVPAWVFAALRVPIGAASTAVLCTVLFGLFGRPLFGTVFGLVAGVLVSLALGLVSIDIPRRIVLFDKHDRRVAARTILADLGFVLVGGVGGGLVAGLVYGLGYGILAGMAFGLVFATVRRLTKPTEPHEAITPSGLLSSDRLAVIYAAAAGAATGAVVGGFLGGIVGTRGLGFVLHLNAPEQGLLGAAIGACFGGCVLGLMMQSNSASGRFLGAQIWLAFRHRLPFPLMPFLRYAHEVGALRQVGAHYQFSHASLQDRLASRDEVDAFQLQPSRPSRPSEPSMAGQDGQPTPSCNSPSNT
jgi:hypothetical protein